MSLLKKLMEIGTELSDLEEANVNYLSVLLEIQNILGMVDTPSLKLIAEIVRLKALDTKKPNGKDKKEGPPKEPAAGKDVTPRVANKKKKKNKGRGK